MGTILHVLVFLGLIGIFISGIMAAKNNSEQYEKPEPRIIVTATTRTGMTGTTTKMLINLSVREMILLESLKQEPQQIERDGVLYQIWVKED